MKNDWKDSKEAILSFELPRVGRGNRAFGKPPPSRPREHADQSAEAKRERQRRWTRKSGAKHARRRKLASYGLTEETFAALLELQGGRCRICSAEISEATQLGSRGSLTVKVPTATTITIDHCHATNRVRGLLCMLCNRGLGDFKDDPERLRRAADYLEGGR